MKLLSVLGFLAVSATLLHAQDETAPETAALPSGPLIQKRAPEYSRWTLTSFAVLGKPSLGGASAAPPSASPNPTTNTGTNPNSKNTSLSTTTITKTGQIIHVTWTDWNREVWNIWVQGRLQAFVWPDGKKIGIPAPPPPSVGSKIKILSPLFQDFSNSDFHGFEWISPSNFTGVQLIGGKKCLVFKNDTSIAATDFETRLPVQLQADGEFTLYRFQQIGETMQTPPEEVQKYFKSLPHSTASAVPTPAPY